MKRVGYLTERIADIDNLYLAYRKACRGKQCKVEVKCFTEEFDANINVLRNEILSGTVDVGYYHYFRITDPKERLICASSFKERILHHAIMNVCHKYFDRSLICHTYATRKGKGLYSALNRAVEGASKYEFLVKLDYRKYYDSIDHDILKEKLFRKFKDERLLNIFDSIIDSYHSESGKGLPIGNLTSQYFANTYLSDIDHYAKEKWGAKVYVRYMDDILITASSLAKLKYCVENIKCYSQSILKLSLKPPIYRKSDEGVNFLGYKVLPYRYLLSGRSKRRFRLKLRNYTERMHKGDWTEQDYAEHILPLLSFVQHAESFKFRKSCL